HPRCSVCFVQAEDGIRDRNVTGVQTCALPISMSSTSTDAGSVSQHGLPTESFDVVVVGSGAGGLSAAVTAAYHGLSVCVIEKSRSEERRVGKEGGGRCARAPGRARRCIVHPTK